MDTGCLCDEVIWVHAPIMGFSVESDTDPPMVMYADETPP